jgi:hypothetical protein
MSLKTVSSDLSVAAPIPAASSPEGTDLLVRSGPQDQSFWDRHPDVARDKVAMRPGQAQIEDWEGLVWVKPGASDAAVTRAANTGTPQRPAGAAFVVHAADDLNDFGRHPHLAASQVTLAFNGSSPGSVPDVQVWMTVPAAG